MKLGERRAGTEFTTDKAKAKFLICFCTRKGKDFRDLVAKPGGQNVRFSSRRFNGGEGDQNSRKLTQETK